MHGIGNILFLGTKQQNLNTVIAQGHHYGGFRPMHNLPFNRITIKVRIGEQPISVKSEIIEDTIVLKKVLMLIR